MKEGRLVVIEFNLGDLLIHLFVIISSILHVLEILVIDKIEDVASLESGVFPKIRRGNSLLLASLLILVLCFNQYASDRSKLSC